MIYWEAMKWIFIYLRGTSKILLSFGTSHSVLEGFTNVDKIGYFASGKEIYIRIHFHFYGDAISIAN